ncbi:tRNA(m5U54)methyltransferase [Bachmanniomyces sp. S44760]|nr:tRNA(m5U54)methyltransferase [Bachmanniomyces sp. S44760]
MLSYEDQLIHKKSIIERAYRNFSTLIPEYIPEVGETIGSPLQYGYRTKLTPHFDGPPGSNSKKGRREGVAFTEVPNIGFMQKGTRKTIDIEDCPIGTDAVRKGMKYERSRVANDLAKYKRGATLLLRESTKRMSKDLAIQQPGTSNDPPEEQNKSLPIRGPPSLDLDPNPSDVPIIRTEHESYTEEKTCITDSNATSTEYIDAFKLSNKAGAFFQNNNSILPIFTAYIRSHALPSGSSPDLQPWHLIDAYCGSGLFTITLSSLFSTSTGIDISPASITSANANATANKIPNSKFTTTDASALFKNVSTPPDFTVVIIDPPRKGCDMPFLEQLLRYGPKRIVYVSCNVHTQARDVGVLVEGGRGGGGGGGGGRGVTRYEIESLQGFDFFPQTGHVEGVAVLNRSVGTESMEDDNAMKEAAVVVGSDGEEEGKEAGFTSDKINSTDVDTKHDHDAEQNDGSDSDPDGGVLLKRKRSE